MLLIEMHSADLIISKAAEVHLPKQYLDFVFEIV